MRELRDIREPHEQVRRSNVQGVPSRHRIVLRMLVPPANLADELLLVNDRCGYESNAQDRRSNV
jgi:hypothetical protein